MIALGAGCIYVGYVFRSVRWAYLLRHNKKVHPLSLLGTQVIGFTAVALIGRVADPVRPYLVVEEDRPAAEQPDRGVHRGALVRCGNDGADLLLGDSAVERGLAGPTLCRIRNW